VLSGVVSMCLGTILVYPTSYHAYSEGMFPVCVDRCTSSTLIPLPTFSIDQTLALVIVAIVPLISILDSREPFRFISAAASLTVGFVVTANLLLPLDVLFPPAQVVVTGSNFAPLLVRVLILVVASGSLIAISGLGPQVRIGIPRRIATNVSVALLFSLAFLCPILLVTIGPSSLSFDPAVGFIAVAAGAGVLTSCALVIGLCDETPPTQLAPS
jgi:hypothetical protein